MAHLIGAYGEYWSADRVDWGSRNWRLLGRADYTHKQVQAVDFRYARGIYILHDDRSTYYVGLATGKAGIGGRLNDHTRDRHAGLWTRFSWFSFDSVAGEPEGDGVYGVETHDEVEMNDNVAIRELEALLQVVMAPSGNRNRTQFNLGGEWQQLPTSHPLEDEILEHLVARLV